MSSLGLPSDYTNEIRALDREVSKQQPADLLQFCADFFLRRLASQRAEFRIAQHQTTMADSSSFPGGNPFSAPTSNIGMQAVAEEDEHDFASPTASSFPPNASMTHNAAPTSGSASPFGNFGFTPAGTTNTGAGARSPPPAGGDGTQSFPSNYNMNRRTSVSAESLAPAGADEAHWKAPQYPKSQDQLTRLREAVAHNFLFSHLDDEQAAQVLGALQERKVPAKDVRVIVQGDAGDYFYIVEQGNFDIYVNKSGTIEPGLSGLGDKVAASGAGTSFGELALMYNAPRAATVMSTEPSTLWQLDRVTFRRILMDSAFQRRRMYEAFLEEVPLLASLTPYERSKIADALETSKHPAGSTIIREGDVGDKFYLLENGEAEARKRGANQPLKQYRKGDYFGELALLEDKPRAASVLSTTEVKVATLGKDGFQRLLGPVESIMRRDDPRKREDNVDPLHT